MQFAINVPNFGAFGDARTLANLAREAETSGTASPELTHDDDGKFHCAER
jgi:hypothetical protein